MLSHHAHVHVFVGTREGLRLRLGGGLGPAFLLHFFSTSATSNHCIFICHMFVGVFAVSLFLSIEKESLLCSLDTF